MGGIFARFLAVGLVLAVLLPGTARAQNDEENTEVTVNYVYAAQLGIGGYSVGGLDVQVFTLPLSYTFDLERRSAENGRPWRLKVSAPINLGLYEFSATAPDGTLVEADQQTLAVIPGVELQIPMSETWTLKPFVDAGIGRGLQSGSHFAYIYTVGARSLYEHPVGDYTFMLGNGLFYAGNALFDGGVSEDYSAIETGLAVRRPVGFEVWGIEPDLGLYGIYYYYPRPLEFQRFLQSTLRVRNQFEVGMWVGSAGPFEIGPITDPKIGIGYIFGDDLEVFRINFGFPF
jgi:hypothetical protein